MNKTLKISLLSVASILVVLLITILTLTWLVFTPSKLTPIVRNQASNYISCKSELGSVELTFFSTFPQFGIKIHDLKLINAMQGASSDTLLSSETTLAAIDFKALWSKNELILHNLHLKNVTLNAFVDKTGKANYDVYKSSSKDTSAFKNPFERIDLKDFTFSNVQISYINLFTSKFGKLRDLNGKLNFKMKGDNVLATILADSHEVSFRMDSTDYLKKSTLSINIPIQYEMKSKLGTLKAAKIILNGLVVSMDGTFQLSSINDDIITSIHFSTEKYQIKSLLEMVPPTYSSALKGKKLDGIINTNGTVTGVYNAQQFPVFNVNLQFEKGTFEYEGFSYKLREILGNADVLINLNDELASKLILNDVMAKTGQSEIHAKGLVDYIMADDMLFDLDMKMQLNLPELEPMMPDGMSIKLNGMATGTAKARFMLSEAMAMNLEKMNISGKFDAPNLSINYDSILMSADNARLDLIIPNAKKTFTHFMHAGLWCNKMNVYKGNNTKSTIYNVNLLTEISDFRKKKAMNTLNCDFNFDQMSASMDNMFVNLEKSNGKLALKMNLSDSVSLPEVSCNFDVKSLRASKDTMSAIIEYPKGELSMRSDKLHHNQAVFDIKYSSNGTFANRGGGDSFSAKQMNVKANIVHNDNEKSTMLQWTPTGIATMEDGKITLNGLKANIQIPVMEFSFTPDDFIVKKAKLIVDNSDFQLTGKLWNVTNYLQNKGLLNGDFNFTSNKTDVYRFMELSNGFGVKDSATISTTKPEQETNSGPYMVPKGMNLKLNAKINEVHLGFDTAHNVLGDLYVKDGLLVLENMRFATSAAKMQLTTMYRTPRKNHLFVGMDFHITDMEISELLKMIPDIDTIMPMLRSFGGKGEFHIAVETYLDSTYHFKKSTLRGVSSIKGENLTLMDGETFSEIAKTLQFNKQTKNRVDSLSAEFTIFKNEVDIYPFLIVMDKYKAVVAGRHNLDMTFNYHISVTDSPLPIKLGVNVTGKSGDMKISLAKCKYANLYRPVARKEIDTKQLEIRQMIRNALTKEVIK
ncbi:MAG: AsmA-like C-terminal region-containing protein [Paludibacter sp.]